MDFADRHRVRSGETLWGIAREYGYRNPGPIFAAPGNAAAFRRRDPNFLLAGKDLTIPWRPDLLRKIIATCTYLASEIVKTATALIQEQSANRASLEDFLFKIDAANFLASLGAGLGSLAVQGARGAEMTAKEAVLWLVESRLSVGANIATMSIPAPAAPKRDFRFYVRHTLGPWNPSFWASVAVAIREQDLDLYLYGADATTYKASLAIKRQADKDLDRLRKRASQAERQLGMSFYAKVL